MAKSTKKNIFANIAERWFLTEPALFQTYCSYQMVANSSIACLMRTGRGRIEYNPNLIASLPDTTVGEALRAEVLRILLKHPYERKPFNCSDTACTFASDSVLASYYKWNHINVAKPGDLGLPIKQHYEWYAIQIEKQLQHDGTMASSADATDSESGTSNSSTGTSHASSDNATNISNEFSSKASTPSSNTSDNADNSSHEHDRQVRSQQFLQSKAAQSELWDEDSMMQVAINELIDGITSWGTVPGEIVERIIASTKARIDYRKVLAGFRASIISSRRSLTRMRPNRRTGFQNMGSLYRFRTNLLIGVDVSGSVSSETLKHVYSVINRFFAYGIENIDVVQFDCSLGTVCNIKKAMHEVEVCGRGGTNFQPVIDYAHSHLYDGLLIFTDGEAPVPKIPPHSRTKLLWICQDDETFNAHHQWMKETGRVCVIYGRE